MLLRIEVTGDGPRRVVRLRGECDIASAPALQEALQPLRGPDVTDVVVDTSDLDFLDSTGLGVLIGALKRLRETGGELRIAGASGAVLRVLEVTGLDKVIPLTDVVP